MKILSYILSPIFISIFFLILLIFHPLQWLGLKIGGYKGHNIASNYMNLFLTKSLWIIGVGVQFKNKYKLPENTSIIFVSNHQSLFEIPPISWNFKKQHPKFVSKKELGKGIPSVSFNLRNGGAALIDRSNAKQALVTLAKFAKKINTNKRSAVIFPEGTRSRNGVPKVFSANGLKMLTKYNPEGYVVPITVNNSWKIFKYGKYPLGLFTPITIETHEPIQINSLPFGELMTSVEQVITSNIKQ